MIIASGKMSKAEKDKISVEERKWRARDDAHTLKNACEIQKDSARFKAAKEALKEKAKEAMESAKEYGAVSSNYGDKKLARRSRTKKSTEARLEGQKI